MKTYTITLTSVNAVKAFVNAANKKEYEIDLVSGRYLIDAKSIMGIFSLDLSKPIRVEIHADDKECEQFGEEIKAFIV